MQTLVAADIPAGPVNTMEEAFRDPQLVHRRMLQHLEHPVEGRIPQLGFPIKLSDTPGAMRAPPPLLGQHTQDVLRDLGYGAEDISAFARDGVI